MRTSLHAFALCVGLLLLSAACAEQDGAPAEEGGSAAEEAPADDAAEDAAVDAGDAAVDAGDAAVAVAVGDTELGEVLVDADGMTLYLFDPDEQGEPTCVDDCVASWPPLLADGDPSADPALDAARLGVVERPEGTMQVTFDGWPLYRWAGDQAPGEVNGQGVGDAWWVLTPEGEPQRSAEPADETASY